jgi:hypothetical protein
MWQLCYFCCNFISQEFAICVFFRGCNLVFINTSGCSHIVFKHFFDDCLCSYIFSVVILFTMEQERNDGGHQCGQQGEQQGGQNI